MPTPAAWLPTGGSWQGTGHPAGRLELSAGSCWVCVLPAAAARRLLPRPPSAHRQAAETKTAASLFSIISVTAYNGAEKL